MRFYRFRSSDGRIRALVQDRSGSALPHERYAWEFLGPMTVDETVSARHGLAPEAIASRVDQDGYFILPTPR